MATPIKLLELTIRNFMSYGNNTTTINLDFKDPVMIVGRNHDAAVNGQVDSNGAGKSAILDAIAYAIYDKTISNKDKTKLINNVNNKDLEVTLTFSRNGINYKIIRSRKTKTKADIQLLVMGKDGEYVDKTPDSIANANAEIEKIVGLPFDIFARIIVFSATFQPFLDLPSRHASQASQTSIMDELFGNTELNDKAEALKEKIKQVKAEFSHIEELQAQIANEISRQKSQLEDVRNRVSQWDVTHANKISEIETEISTLSKLDLDADRKVLADIDKLKDKASQLSSDKKVLEAELRNLESQIDSINDKRQKMEAIKQEVERIEKTTDFDKEEKILDAIDSLSESVSSTDSEISKLKQELKSIDPTLKNIDKDISHLEDDECPYCGQEIADSADKLKALKDQKKTLLESIDTINESITKLEETSEKDKDKLEKLKNKAAFDNRAQFNKAKTQYEINKAQLQSHTESDDSVSTDRIDEIKNELTELNESIAKLTSAITKLQGKTKFSSISEIEKLSARKEALGEKLNDLKTETNPHIETFNQMEKLVSELEAEDDKTEKLNQLDTTLKHQEFLLKLLTKKDSFLRKNLLDRSLPFLNKRLMGYLEKLGLPHRVEFQPDMSAHISQFGTELDFSSLSSGQKARVNLALAFAFRDVLQATHGKISFCMLDECLDHGLGNVGVQLAAKMIKQIAVEENMSMFVISHRDEVTNMFPKQLVVELKNGFSTITST